MENSIADYAKELAEKHTKQKDTQTQQTQGDTNANNATASQGVDNKENNSYIKDNSQNNQDPDDKLFRETFGGDPKKLAEAYRNSQREFTKMQSSLKETERYKEIVDQLDSVYNRDPLVKEVLEAATRGESAENYLKNKLKLGETNKSTDTFVNGKLGSDVTSADENSLAKNGYLDLNAKANYTAMEWQNEVMKARLNYATNEVPRIAMEKTLAEMERKQKELRDSQDRQTAVETNNQRFERQFNEALRAGYDFAGEHKDIYMQAVEDAKYMVDRRNPKLIREDAFLIALDSLAKQTGKLPKQQVQQQAKKETINYNKPSFFNGGRQPQAKLEGLDLIKAKAYEQNTTKLNNRFNRKQT